MFEATFLIVFPMCPLRAVLSALGFPSAAASATASAFTVVWIEERSRIERKPRSFFIFHILFTFSFSSRPQPVSQVLGRTNQQFFCFRARALARHRLLGRPDARAHCRAASRAGVGSAAWSLSPRAPTKEGTHRTRNQCWKNLPPSARSSLRNGAWSAAPF